MSDHRERPLPHALATVALLLAMALPAMSAPPPAAVAKAPAAVGPVRVIAVGDIACDPATPAYANGAG